MVKTSSGHKIITIGHLYPKQMNVYGDMGNIITLRYRLEERGYRVDYVPIDSATDMSAYSIDILVGGGGQDSNQDTVQQNLLSAKKALHTMAEDGVVMLMICGMYQLFGHRFVVSSGHIIEGVGVLDVETVASDERLIGNVVVESDYGMLVGFENHSGRTTLGPDVVPLGLVKKGAGNNGQSSDEGAVYQNVFGSYLHGPLLAKNPVLADELISRALKNRYGSGKLTPLDDEYELSAQAIASKRPR